MGLPPALRSATGRGRAVQGSAALPCCAPLPLVAPFPSLSSTPVSTDSTAPSPHAAVPRRARKSPTPPVGYRCPPGPAPTLRPAARAPRGASLQAPASTHRTVTTVSRADFLRASALATADSPQTPTLRTGRHAAGLAIPTLQPAPGRATVPTRASRRPLRGRCRPSLPFPALPPRRGTTFIRRFALLRFSFPPLAALRSLRLFQRRPAPLPTAPIRPPPPQPKQHPNASQPHRRRAAPGPAKGLTPPVSPPPIRLQAAGWKSLPPASKVCVPATQAEARPASRRVSLGSAPSPRHHAPAHAWSSSSPSAASRWSATTGS